jgi:hypothetical protein
MSASSSTAGGEPSVIIMSIKDYLDTIAPAPKWLVGIQASSKRRGTNRLTIQQIDAEIAKVRSRTRQPFLRMRPRSSS